jgi:hypothetical protein
MAIRDIYGHLEYLRTFGIFCGYLVYFSRFGIKNLATLLGAGIKLVNTDRN